MPTAVQDFGQCLRELLAEKKISASELARMMAYKSRNSIFRILDGEGAHGARLAFFERLRDENPLGLDEGEMARLTQALEISRVGAGAYRTNLAMRELLTGGEKEKAHVRVVSAGGKDTPELIDEIVQARQVDIVITGCCDRGILSSIRERLVERGDRGGLRVTHFIYTGDEELVRAINAIQPMLYADFYTVYAVEPGVFTKEREQIYRSNYIFIRWQDEALKWHDQPMILMDRNLFYAIKNVSGREYSALREMILPDIAKMTPIKTKLMGESGEPDYVAYTEMCRRMEQNRAIYTVKLDVPFAFIDPKILVPCALESFVDMAQEERDGIIAALRAVHEKRFENIFSKHKMTHTILSLPFMERFAKTGRQTDHFFALRPYTGDERAAILSHIREQAESNPYFNVYFFKEGVEPPLMEIGLYEGTGTLMTKPFTDYNLAGDHAETLITSGEFCAGYKAFFTDDLLARRVMEPQETLAALDRLIEIAKSE